MTRFVNLKFWPGLGVFWRAWRHDLFTSLLVGGQFSEDVLVPAFGDTICHPHFLGRFHFLCCLVSVSLSLSLSFSLSLSLSLFSFASLICL